MRERRDAARRGADVRLPTDVVIASEVGPEAPTTVVPADAIPDGQRGLDIGPASVASFADAMAGAATILWNGPMGVFEMASFAGGTEGVARAIAASEAFSVVGGGDSLLAVRRLGLEASFGHLSTGGGASLEFLEGRELPGLAVIPMAGSPVETPPIIWHTPPPAKASKRSAPKSAAKQAPKAGTQHPDATGDDPSASEEEQ